MGENLRNIVATDADFMSLSKPALIRLIKQRWGITGFSKHDIEFTRAEVMQETALADMGALAEQMQGLHGWKNRAAYFAAQLKWEKANKQSDKAFKIMDRCNQCAKGK